MSNDEEFLNFYHKLKSDQSKNTTDHELANLLRQEGFLLYNESLKKADNYIPGAIAKEHFANYSDLVSKIGNNSVNNYTSAVVSLLKANNKVVNTSMWATSIGNPEKYLTSGQSIYTDCSCEEFYDSDLTDFPVCSERSSPKREDVVDSSKNHVTNQVRSDLRSFLTRQESNIAAPANILQKETVLPPKVNPCLPPLLQTLPPKSIPMNVASPKSAPLNLSSHAPVLMNLPSSTSTSPVFPSTSNNKNPRQINEEKEETITSFRTAKDELLLQNVKKYGTANPSNQQPLFSYGASKKSLGARRTVKNSFVPPIKQDEIEKQEVSNMQVDDYSMNERLRNIDPKMIELITSEIMHKFKPIAWSDIAGLEYAKKTIQEAVVWPLLRPDIFTGLRRPPRGILLFGPPGTGKTLIGKCIASQSKSTFFSISASSLTSKWIGDGEKMVRALFAVASAHQPSVVFIDEIDSLLCQRSESEHESSRRIKTEFLVQLDGAATSEEERILIVGATNRPQELDEAARRRLTRRLYIPLPEVGARLQILTNLLKSVKHSMADEHILEIANLTEGYSGADMECLCREASMEPIRAIPPDQIPYFDENEVRPVNFEDFRSALGRIRASVSQNDLKQYIEWNKVYGSGNVR